MSLLATNRAEGTSEAYDSIASRVRTLQDEQVDTPNTVCLGFEKQSGAALCLNGGKCHSIIEMNNSSHDEINSADLYCTCAKGYSGPHCEYIEGHLPECSLPCKNDGECKIGRHVVDDSDDIDKFENTHAGNYEYCDCPSSFFGIYCEIQVTQCGPHNVCYNGAECISHAGAKDDDYHYNCDCGSISPSINGKIYAGLSCQYESTAICHLDDVTNPFDIPFTAEFCTNNGTCPVQSSLPCDCPDGYSGPHCEFTTQELNHRSYEDNQCLLDCKNGGVCQMYRNEEKNNDLVEKCICPKGYTGLECEYEYVTCGASSGTNNTDVIPCFHGSACVVDKNGYNPTCDCRHAPVFAAGQYCEYTATDVCNTTSTNQAQNQNAHRGFCVNNGKCVLGKDAAGSVSTSCKCEHPFSGPYCEFLSESALLIESDSQLRNPGAAALERLSTAWQKADNKFKTSALILLILISVCLLSNLANCMYRRFCKNDTFNKAMPSETVFKDFNFNSRRAMSELEEYSSSSDFDELGIGLGDTTFSQLRQQMTNEDDSIRPKRWRKHKAHSDTETTILSTVASSSYHQNTQPRNNNIDHFFTRIFRRISGNSSIADNETRDLEISVRSLEMLSEISSRRGIRARETGHSYIPQNHVNHRNNHHSLRQYKDNPLIEDPNEDMTSEHQFSNHSFEMERTMYEF